MKTKYVLYYGTIVKNYSKKTKKIYNRLEWCKLSSYYKEEQALERINKHQEKYSNKLKLVKEEIIYQD